MANRFNNIASASLTFGANHRCTFINATQRLAEIAATTDERNLKLMLIYVIFLIGRRQDFALVDVVDANSFQDLRLDKMTDAAFCHHRNADRFHNALDHAWIAHTGYAPLHPNISGDSLKGHDGASTHVFSNIR